MTFREQGTGNWQKFQFFYLLFYLSQPMQGYFILNFAILYIYENTLLPALDNASLAICKASKFIAKI